VFIANPVHKTTAKQLGKIEIHPIFLELSKKSVYIYISPQDFTKSIILLSPPKEQQNQQVSCNSRQPKAFMSFICIETDDPANPANSVMEP
jgi:hypothetical protein